MAPLKDDDMHTDLRARVVAIEAWKIQMEIAAARLDERWGNMEANMGARFTSLERSLDSVSGTLTWIMRIVIGGILMGVVGFMLRGGFAPL